MRALSEIIQAAGIQADEAQIGALQQELAKDYRSIEEMERKNEAVRQRDERISELEGQVESLGAKAAELESAGDEKVAELQRQVEEFKRADEERKAAEAESRSRAAFEGEFERAVGGREFANGLVRESVLEKAYRTRSENPAMAVEDILKGIVGDQGGVWKNPQQDPARMPKPGSNGAGGEGGKPAINSKDDLRGMSPADINANWERVREVLAR